jgi:type VI secretion system protein ImpM
MAARFGAFGKLPALGDFLRMDLPASFVDPWDRWLQEGMLAARASLGDRWQESYFSAPIWRFALSPGLAGAAAMVGVTMMSVDRVGRQFPLTLASPLPDGQTAAGAHMAGLATFLALDMLALDALEDSMTRDVLAARLAEVPMPANPVTPEIRRAPGGLVVQAATPDITAALAAAHLAQGFRKPSIWSTELDGAARLMVCEGLPAGGQMLALFDMAAQVWQPELEDA